MKNTHLYGGGDGSGGFSGGSISTFSTEDKNTMMSSEESSSNPDDSEFELGLGLSLGIGGGKAKFAAVQPIAAACTGGCDQYTRILTAEKISSVVSNKAYSSSSSCSSVNRANNNGLCGTKRSADEPSSPLDRSIVSQVVGWPPIRTYRTNTLVSNAKLPVTEEIASTVDKSKSLNIIVDSTNFAKKPSFFVKVNMDGIGIGRKVDLSAHSCYETLSHTLDDMFRPTAALSALGKNVDKKDVVAGARRPLRLLDGKYDFVLTYEDKDRDWMLIGDVPWGMFLSSVRRLRIMKMTEANGISPRSHERNQRQLKRPLIIFSST